jgi:hypothetical protein
MIAVWENHPSINSANGYAAGFKVRPKSRSQIVALCTIPVGPSQFRGAWTEIFKTFQHSPYNVRPRNNVSRLKQ